MEDINQIAHEAMAEEMFHCSNLQIELDIDPDDKVPTCLWFVLGVWLTISQITRIKEKVEEQSGVPPPQQRLIFGGRQMYATASSPLLIAGLNGRL